MILLIILILGCGLKHSSVIQPVQRYCPLPNKPVIVKQDKWEVSDILKTLLVVVDYSLKQSETLKCWEAPNAE